MGQGTFRDFYHKVCTSHHLAVVRISLFVNLLSLPIFLTRVWDVRSGRSVHKLKGHKVIHFIPTSYLLY